MLCPGQLIWLNLYIDAVCSKIKDLPKLSFIISLGVILVVTVFHIIVSAIMDNPKNWKIRILIQSFDYYTVDNFDNS